MESDALTLYKLMILFILDKVDFPLTNAQISNFILEKEYTNYFTIQEAINDLIDSELIQSDTIRNSSYYKITSSGTETLSFFNTKIPEAIKEDIIDYLRKNQYSLREEVSTLSDYFEVKKDEFMVRCQVKERNNTLIDLSISVPGEETAVNICNNWKAKSQEIYSYLISNLINKNKEDKE